MRELLVQVFSNLRANKLRSFLTMFGIMWGVISIVILSAVGDGFQQGNKKVMEELGKNIIIIRNGRTSLQAGGERAGRPIRLTIQDVDALKERSKMLEFVSPELMRGGVATKSAFNAASLQMSGIWPIFQYIRTLEVDRGRLINETDCQQTRRVVLIGFHASKQLFADRDPVGSQVTLSGMPYTIIGRIRKKEQDSNYTGEDNMRLFIPYETMRKDFPLAADVFTQDSISAIIVVPYRHVADEMRRIVDREGSTGWLEGRSPVEYEIREILGRRHGFDSRDLEAVSMWNTAISSIMFSKMTEAMKEFFVAVSIITLALGGIGVMNIMLVAVRERTHEIGIRKALGATPRDILKQFFFEGLFLTLFSGLLGFSIGLGLCKLVNLLPMPERFSGMVITWQTTAFAVVVLTCIGVAASIYPARRAAELPPIEALRYEM
ncbi:MAG TPA: ABC transporter permease [Acidobacteriota bacterium]|jgi:putative ABC transport system permease protein|nr:ABC transporter permease [Acidobacteriota bacterium]